ncbi:MAG TPA: hypothetical protein DCP28_04650 [Cytophagales bacterium]|nr:hypothetical protein [Cytophagales bacterium]
MVDNKLVTEVTLKHTTEPGTVSGLVYDAEDESFIVDQVFGFGPSGYLVDYRVSGIDPSGQAVSWLYQNQIPEIIWD